MDRPNPDGWKGGREDFTFMRTLDGHRTLGEFSEDEVADQDRRENARTTANADLGGAKYDA